MGDPTRTPLPAAAAFPTPALDLVVGRLCAEAARDPRLVLAAPAAEVAAVVEQRTRALWHGSRVKQYVPVLAMREARAALGAEGPVLDAAAAPRRRPRHRPRGGRRDELLLDERDALSPSRDFAW